jgi:hypothetical protein
LVSNDEGQSKDALDLAKKLYRANPILHREVQLKSNEIVRSDGRGFLRILPAGDVAGAHGKTYLFIGFDEIHEYRSWDLMEALAPDPTRRDVLTWLTSYASIYDRPGYPLHDLFKMGRQGRDPRMYFSWYSANFGTDPAFTKLKTPEQRANPSMKSWDNPGYLEQQKRRLPSHKYRRLHLNLPGSPEGSAYDAELLAALFVAGRRVLPPRTDLRYTGFVDMSGGSSDDATVAVAHMEDGKRVLDLVLDQAARIPFNPRHAVKRFATILKQYRIRKVQMDRYAGETFRRDFADQGIRAEPCRQSASQLYEDFEPVVNAGEAELLDHPKLREQLSSLKWAAAKIAHPPGDHDDWANAAVGALVTANRPRRLMFPTTGAGAHAPQRRADFFEESLRLASAGETTSNNQWRIVQ